MRADGHPSPRKARLQLAITGALWGGLAFVCLRYWGHPVKGWIFAGLATSFLLIAAFVPKLAGRIHHALGWTLNAVVNAIGCALLALLYWFVLSPAGLLLRTAGILQTTKRPDPSRPTYWIPRPRDPITPERYRRAF
jgi:hypothetical protein